MASTKPKANIAGELGSLLAGIEGRMYHPLLIIADYYEENGSLWTAKAYRWLVEHKRMPRRLPKGDYCWRGWNYGQQIDKEAGWAAQDLIQERLPCLDRMRRRKVYHEIWVLGAELMSIWLQEQEARAGEGK